MMKLLHDIHSLSCLREPHGCKKKRRTSTLRGGSGLEELRRGIKSPPPHGDEASSGWSRAPMGNEASSGWSRAVHAQSSFSVLQLGVQSEQENKPLGDDADW